MSLSRVQHTVTQELLSQVRNRNVVDYLFKESPDYKIKDAQKETTRLNKDEKIARAAGIRFNIKVLPCVGVAISRNRPSSIITYFSAGHSEPTHG